MDKYEVRSWGAGIRAVEIDRETESSVWVAGNRRKKEGAFFNTWREAHDYLLSKAERSMEQARRSLEHAQGKYGNIKGMKPPIDE